jgi:orotate phosphoribosyltransferase
MSNKSKLSLAAELLKIKAVKLQPEQPFTWASGWKSPFYCDNRKTLSFSSLRTRVKLGLANLILQEFPEADIVAGVATGAIAQGALVAEELAKPFVYVRPKAKDHGMGNQIEGELKAGEKVVVIEDLISTGMSSLKAVDALRQAGCEVLGMVANFTYGFPLAEQQFKEAGVTLTTLSNYNAVLEAAVETNYIAASDVETLKEWRKDPANWGI